MTKFHEELFGELEKLCEQVRIGFNDAHEIVVGPCQASISFETPKGELAVRSVNTPVGLSLELRNWFEKSSGRSFDNVHKVQIRQSGHVIVHDLHLSTAGKR